MYVLSGCAKLQRFGDVDTMLMKGCYGISWYGVILKVIFLYFTYEVCFSLV